MSVAKDQGIFLSNIHVMSFKSLFEACDYDLHMSFMSPNCSNKKKDNYSKFDITTFIPIGIFLDKPVLSSNAKYSATLMGDGTTGLTNRSCMNVRSHLRNWWCYRRRRRHHGLAKSFSPKQDPPLHCSVTHQNQPWMEEICLGGGGEKHAAICPTCLPTVWVNSGETGLGWGIHTAYFAGVHTQVLAYRVACISHGLRGDGISSFHVRVVIHDASQGLGGFLVVLRAYVTHYYFGVHVVNGFMLRLIQFGSRDRER